MIKKFVPMQDLTSLKGKTAIVTGGAMGIGYAICHRLAEAGATVIIADINQSRMEQAYHELRGSGYQIISVLCDVSSEHDVKQMMSSVVEIAGCIDILVNNAGIYPRLPLAEMNSADFDRIIAVNLKSIFLCSREASHRMIHNRKGGSIINIASIDGIHPTAKGLSLYDSSKGAALTATKSLALELGQHNIRVNAIAPGGILTETALTSMSESATQQGKAQLKTFMSRMVLGRMGEPDDIGRVALFLASDLASYITGTVIFVDGGYLIG
jgi:2-deoxy-D-gluconate 3-dehydrogenase